jgi:phosphoglycolate phosphatase-like HAD superfamily hydrolase
LKIIIFDIDGTLTDTKKVDDKCYMTAFKETFAIDIFNQDWAALKNVTDWGITEELIQTRLKREPVAEDYIQLHNQFVYGLAAEYHQDKNQFREVAGATNFVNYLKETTDYKLGIATGSWEKSALTKLNAIGLELSGMSFSHSNFFKTREEITRYSIEQLIPGENFETHDITYFGDGLWDYRTCCNLGIKFIGIDISGDNKLKSAGAEIVFSNYTDVNAVMSCV